MTDPYIQSAADACRTAWQHRNRIKRELDAAEITYSEAAEALEQAHKERHGDDDKHLPSVYETGDYLVAIVSRKSAGDRPVMWLKSAAAEVRKLEQGDAEAAKS